MGREEDPAGIGNDFQQGYGGADAARCRVPSLMCTSLRMCSILHPKTGLRVHFLSKIRNLSDPLGRSMWQHSINRENDITKRGQDVIVRE